MIFNNNYFVCNKLYRQVKIWLHIILDKTLEYGGRIDP